MTLRKDLLSHLGIQPGDKISVNKLADGRVEVKAVRRGTRDAGSGDDVFVSFDRKATAILEAGGEAVRLLS